MFCKETTELEQQLFGLTAKPHELRRSAEPKPVPNYRFTTVNGEVSLLNLFGDKDRLLAIHNMGQGCRYCTLWADGFNGILQHLESGMAVVLLSRDTHRIQRDFANSRNWRFRLASHGGGGYISEQTVMAEEDNMPCAWALRGSAGVFDGILGLKSADWTVFFRWILNGGHNTPPSQSQIRLLVKSDFDSAISSHRSGSGTFRELSRRSTNR